METRSHADIIEDAKKYFFAEDIICYFMISCRFNPNFRIPISALCFRLIPRAFNDVIETAVCFLYSRISVFYTFRSFEANEMLCRGNFLLFAHRLESRYFPNGYNPQKFLYFCTHLAYMAVSFYKAGKTEIPKSAVYYIVRAMKCYEVPDTEFWNGLSIAALRYIKIAFKCGFAKMSDFESMKIQFVVSESFKEQAEGDNHGIAEGSVTNSEEKRSLLKLSAELKRKISMIDDDSSFMNNLSKSGIETLSPLYEENSNQNSTSNQSSTNIKESLKLEVEEESIHENISERECTDPTLTSEISLPKKYRIFQVLTGLVNKPEECVFPEDCECLCNTNRDFAPKDLYNSVMDFLTSNCPNNESNFTSFKSDAEERTENNSNSIDEINQETESPTNSTRCQKFSSRISGEKYAEFFSANEQYKILQNSTSNEESFFNSGKEFVRSRTPEEFPDEESPEIEDCPLKTVDFDICDQFVMKMERESGTDIELFGETHENFISNEDYFNSTFDILSVTYGLATTYGTEILDIGNLV